MQLLGASATLLHCAAPTDDSDQTSESLSGDLTEKQMLADVDHFVVLMMENRSFDHYMGALERMPGYANHKDVNGTNGDEWNLSPEGNRVHIHEAKTFRLQSPPHSFDKSHKQWDGGKNDKFVIEHAGKYQDQAMAYYTKADIPFYYWLAENFTVFDRWHASVMGPTDPNRMYLNCGTSNGTENNDPIKSNQPDTIWDHLRAKGISAKSYHAGRAGLMAHHLPGKKIPFAKIDELFTDAKNGTLPHVSYVEPDYAVNCDHPAHDIRLGQAFVHSVYSALAKSPQWRKTVFFVMYDEHGGFYDHVSPPAAEDHYSDFRRYGFRVPAFAAGGTVKRGYLGQGLHDHTSILATLAARFGLPALSKRAANATPLTAMFDPARVRKASADVAPLPPEIVLDAAALESAGESSQPDFEQAIENGEVDDDLVDPRTLEERMHSWLRHSLELGSIRLVR
ncbi:MAG TPA: alkaline phosphatase family protein [Labilithrix sp.]